MRKNKQIRLLKNGDSYETWKIDFLVSKRRKYYVKNNVVSKFHIVASKIIKIRISQTKNSKGYLYLERRFEAKV